MSEKKRKKLRFKSIAILEAVVIVILAGALIWVGLLRDKLGLSGAVPANANADDPQVRTRAVIDKEETFYQLDGKKILMHDSAYGEVFMPVFEDVPACALNMDNLITRNGYSYYKENGVVTSAMGVDVSEFQGEIDWEQVKAAGIEFAFIRIGYRTYGGGVITYDSSFARNLEAANAAGIKVGAYFFSQATNAEEAIEEADAVIDAIAPYNITYPVVFDWEMVFDDNARTDKVTVEALADCCVAFCERVKSAGYTPMIYQNTGTSMHKLDLPRIKDYDFWLAEYSSKPSYYYDYRIWQYSCTGTVPGIAGEVDMNICFKPY